MKKINGLLWIQILYVVLGILMSAPLASADGEWQTVWTIGKFDGSSREFRQENGHFFARRALPPATPVYVIGASKPEQDWYAFQAISSEKPESPAARKIQFSLPGLPAGAYRLRVALLIEHASVPALKVEINGYHGTFYLDPKLDSRMGDGGFVWFPTYSSASVEFEFPGRYLHAKGINTLALYAMASQPGPVVTDAGFTYDAIELQSQANRRFDEHAASVTVKPTIFYKQEGGLQEVVDALVEYRERARNGSLAITIDGKRYTQPLRGGQDFGQENCQFALPAFEKGTQTDVILSMNGRRREFRQEIEPQKKWTIYVVPHVHLDIGYTDFQAKVAAIQSRIIDEALDLIAKHPDFRFSVDGMWCLDQFLKSRTAGDQQRAMDAIKGEHLFIPAQYSNELTGFPTAETLIRSLYPSANFAREHGTPFNYANITDVPSYSWSYASILASAGLKDFIAANNDGRAQVLLRGHLDENSPFWWEGPDGKKVLFWYAKHYHQLSSLFNLPPVMSAGVDMLPLFLQLYEHPGYRADATILFGSQVENTDLFPQQAEVAEQWNATYAYPHLQYSGFHEALESIAAQFGDNIPTVKGDGGPYWEDGIASDAYYAAMERETESQGPSAEKLSTISALVNPRVAADKAGLDRMWEKMVLMDEHTFTSSAATSDPSSDETVEQIAVKNSFATEAHGISNRILKSSMATLANSIAADAHSLIVFNTLNWPRSALVTWDLESDREIVDRATGDVVPTQLVSAGRRFQRVRFWAQDVPATGYKVYLLRPAKKAAATTATPGATALENSYYRIEFHPSTGSIQSIFDKELRRELVDTSSPYRFAQYLYVTHHASNFDVHGAGQGRMVSIERTPWGEVARLESSDQNTPQIVSEIRLFDHDKKIELIEDVDKQEVHSDEAVYFAFPFAMSHPQFQYEIQNGVVDPSKDMYPGAGLDWFSVQNWVSVQQDGISATVLPLDTPLVTLGDITRLTFPQTFGTRKGWIFSYAMNNYWHVNYLPGQGGHFRFRFIITSVPSTDPIALSRKGWEEATPMELEEITDLDKASSRPEPLDGTKGSFLSVEDPKLLLETWKPAEDGNGTILRFLDLGGEERTVAVEIPLLNLDHAWTTDAVERNDGTLRLVGTHAFNLEVHPHEILTVRVTGALAHFQ